MDLHRGLTEHERSEYERLRQRNSEDAVLIDVTHLIEGGASQAWICEMCDRSQRYATRSRAELLIHFQAAHKLQPAEWADATQQHIAHSDAAEWYQDDYRMSCMGRVLCLRSSRISRRHDDWRR